MELRERFLAAIDYIEEHLMEPVSLADAARPARVSPAFTRAFKRAFGVPPGAYRKAGRPVTLGLRQRLDARSLETLQEVVSMEPEIREIASFLVVGVRERFDQESKAGIPALWDRLIPLIPQIPKQTGGGTYGICLNTDGESGSFDYIAGVPVEAVDALPDGLIAETIPRQTYAVFTHEIKGENLHEELQPTLQWIWGTWLPSARYAHVPGPDLEIYPEGFETTRGHSLEICVPVQSPA